MRSVHMKTRNLVGISLIHYAVTNNQFAMVQFLIERGANVNELHENFATPLHIAAKFGSDAMIRLLLDSGGDPNIASESGITPLAVALFFDNIEVAKTLLKGGAAVTTQCLYNRFQVKHSIMLFRGKLHIWAKEIVKLDTGFKRVFLIGCSRANTSLGLLYNKHKVLHSISRFLDIEKATIVDNLKQAVTSIESVEWESFDERGVYL